MGLRVPIEALADSIPALRASGVISVTLDAVEYAEAGDTIPAPPTVRGPHVDAHPEVFPDEALSSERIAAEFGWVESPGEPGEFEHFMCAGANVAVRR